jgi:pSer/pThr/pTyr-binding forkhead associated (FHA) protein
MTKLGICQVRGLFESEVVVLNGPELGVGRSPGDGLFIQDEGISRLHGLFTCHGPYWFYKDLGSTNGSFVNGQALPENLWRVLRSGDILQLADISMKLQLLNSVGESCFPEEDRPHLLLFSGSSFLGRVDVFRAPVKFGGPSCDFACRGVETEILELLIEFDSRAMNASGFSANAGVFLNKERLVGTQSLKHGDVLQVQNYVVAVNDPAQVLGQSYQGQLFQSSSLVPEDDCHIAGAHDLSSEKELRSNHPVRKQSRGAKFKEFGTLDDVSLQDGSETLETKRCMLRNSNEAWERASQQRVSVAKLSKRGSVRSPISTVLVALATGVPIAVMAISLLAVFQR